MSVIADGIHSGDKPFSEQLWRPVAERIGIGNGSAGHTYSTLLRGLGAEFKVMQELMRHSSLRSKIDIYTQAVTPSNRAAQAAVLSLVFPANPHVKAQ
jgi:integrase